MVARDGDTRRREGAPLKSSPRRSGFAVAAETHLEPLAAVVRLSRVEAAEHAFHVGGGIETIGASVGVAELFERDDVHRFDGEVTQPRRESALTDLESRAAPSADGGSLLSGADGVEETLLEKELPHVSDEKKFSSRRRGYHG